MDQLGFNTYVLARVLAEAGAAIVVGGVVIYNVLRVKLDKI